MNNSAVISLRMIKTPGGQYVATVNGMIFYYTTSGSRKSRVFPVFFFFREITVDRFTAVECGNPEWT